jgi:small subunit ribosomal protein S7
MSRRRRAAKRTIVADARYGDEIVTRFINCLMFNGKRSVAEHIVYGALEMCSEKVRRDPLVCFHEILDNIKPTVEVCSRRVGGATYQVPVEVRTARRVALAIRWLIQASRKRSEKTMVDRLAAEMVDAINNRGGAVKKREESHRMAEANKAFSHYRW